MQNATQSNQIQDRSDAPADIMSLGKLVEGIKFAMLTTIDNKTGALHSRPMTLQEAEFDGHFWFFTSKSGGIAADIRTQSGVNLAFSKPNDSAYASVTGRAEIIDDKIKSKELWNPIYKAWFPDGLEDPDLTLLCVHVESADYWDSPSSKVVQLFGFAKAMITGERGNSLGTHHHLEVGEHRH